MGEIWAIPMLISAGLFAGGVMTIAWERLPAWRETELADFHAAFAHTLRRVDRLQPAMLVVCMVSTLGFALGTESAARATAMIAAAALFGVLVGSARLVGSDPTPTDRGHGATLRGRAVAKHLVPWAPPPDGRDVGGAVPRRRRGHSVMERRPNDADRIGLWTVVMLRLPLLDYSIDFRRSLRKADPALPILLVVCGAATGAFAVLATGGPRMLAISSLALQTVVLIGSITLAEPINSQFRRRPEGTIPPDAERLRRRWRRLHLVRTGLVVAAFGLIVVAASHG